ncbi:MAG: hypothetical protein ACRD0P_38775, partial [Stackebrandtia sp.]
SKAMALDIGEDVVDIGVAACGRAARRAMDAAEPESALALLGQSAKLRPLSASDQLVRARALLRLGRVNDSLDNLSEVATRVGLPIPLDAAAETDDAAAASLFQTDSATPVQAMSGSWVSGRAMADAGGNRSRPVGAVGSERAAAGVGDPDRSSSGAASPGRFPTGTSASDGDVADPSLSGRETIDSSLSGRVPADSSSAEAETVQPGGRNGRAPVPTNGSRRPGAAEDTGRTGSAISAIADGTDPAGSDAGSATETVGDPVIAARVLMIAGRAYRAEGEPDRAMRAWSRAFEVARAAGLKTEQADALCRLGMFDYLGGRMRRAEERFTTALRVATEGGDRRAQAWA